MTKQPEEKQEVLEAVIPANQVLFEFDPEEKHIKVTKTIACIFSKSGNLKKLAWIPVEGKMYVTALNKNHAEKKVLKRIQEIIDEREKENSTRPLDVKPKGTKVVTLKPKDNN